MARAVVRRVIGVWLMVDGITTAMWFSQLLDSLGGRDAVSVAAIVLRVVVAALSVVAGWLVTQRRPPGPPLASAALTLMAAFSLLSAWTGVLPSNLDPSFRWPVAAGLTTVAGLAVLFLRHDNREHSADGSTRT